MSAARAPVHSFAEQLVEWEVTFEDEFAAVFDLRDRIEAREIDALALLDGELRPEV